MWVTLGFLGVIVLVGVAAATGRAVHDSRDTAYGLRVPAVTPPPPLSQPPATSGPASRRPLVPNPSTAQAPGATGRSPEPHRERAPTPTGTRDVVDAGADGGQSGVRSRSRNPARRR